LCLIMGEDLKFVIGKSYLYFLLYEINKKANTWRLYLFFLV
jgi:hypothetical protein